VAGGGTCDDVELLCGFHICRCRSHDERPPACDQRFHGAWRAASHIIRIRLSHQDKRFKEES
jgi:hypothetical protein